jgi:uncharacterized membrane protein
MRFLNSGSGSGSVAVTKKKKKKKREQKKKKKKKKKILFGYFFSLNSIFSIQKQTKKTQNPKKKHQ